jgi:hypothetical protein
MIVANTWISETAKFAGAVLLELLAVAVFVVLRAKLEKRVAGMNETWRRFILLAITIVSAFGFALAWQSSRSDFLRIVHWLAAVMRWGVFQGVVALVVAVLGGFAYWFKSEHQFVYGLVELPVALGTAMISAGGITSNPDSFSRIATIAGCVYIMSRGLENMVKGAEEKDEGARMTPVRDASRNAGHTAQK